MWIWKQSAKSSYVKILWQIRININETILLLFIDTEKLSGGFPAMDSDWKPSNDQHLKTNKIPAVHNECKMCTSESSGLLNLKERVRNPMTQNSTFRHSKWYPKSSMKN